MGRRLLVALALAPLVACSLLSLPETDGAVDVRTESGTVDGTTSAEASNDAATITDGGGASSKYAAAVLADKPVF